MNPQQEFKFGQMVNLPNGRWGVIIASRDDLVQVMDPDGVRTNWKTSDITLHAPADVQKDPEGFAAWLRREIPAGTVISDPDWWAPRIFKAAHTPKPTCGGGIVMSEEKIVPYYGDMSKKTIDELLTILDEYVCGLPSLNAAKNELTQRLRAAEDKADRWEKLVDTYEIALKNMEMDRNKWKQKADECLKRKGDDQSVGIWRWDY